MSAPFLTAAQLCDAADQYRICDLRNERDRAYGAIPFSVAYTEEDLLRSPPQGPLVIVCAHGERSDEVAQLLCSAGYDAYNLKGGYLAWMREMLARQRAQGDALCQKVEQSLRKRFRKTLMSPFTKALKEYKMISPGDRIAVCMSGGKDSMLLAKLFSELHRHTEIPFSVEYLVMDPGYSPQNRRVIEENARALQLPIRIFESDIFSSVYNVEKSPCYLCARMRRGHLYRFAKELGCNKIALGHHFDDVIETILMGMLHGAQVQTMMPKLHSTNFPGMELIRPLYYVREDDIKAWRDFNDLHFLQCACKFTDSCTSCNDGQNHSMRQDTKELIRQLKKTDPDVEKHIFRSMEGVNLNTVISYKKDGVLHHFLDSYDSPAE